MSKTTTCRHYATVGPPHTIKPPIEGMDDPEHLLVDLVECVPDAEYVTLVFDVDMNRVLRLADVLPHTSLEDGMRIVRRLKANGVSHWFAQEHAAFTGNGWIDVEALEGEPMTRAHR